MSDNPKVMVEYHKDLTREKILAMEAGRELDALVAEKVMRWKERIDFDYVNGHIARYVPGTNDVIKFNPSESISAAWEVVEKMNDCLHLREHGAEGEWEASFCGYSDSTAHGETAPLAICKSSLLAVMNL